MGIEVTRVSKRNVNKLNHHSGATAVTGVCRVTVGDFAVSVDGTTVGRVWSFVSEEPGMSGKRWGWSWLGQVRDDMDEEWRTSHVYGVRSKESAVRMLLIKAGQLGIVTGA